MTTRQHMLVPALISHLIDAIIAINVVVIYKGNVDGDVEY